MTGLPAVDVVILTWNDGELLDVAVRSALASEGADVHVAVVDNGSEPPAEVPYPGVRLVRNAMNTGVAGGRNQGAALGNAPFLCFLDSDAELAPHSLRHLVEALDDPTVGVAVPVFEGQVPEASAGVAPTLRVKIERGLGRRDTYLPAARASGADSWDVDFGIGACQVIRRDVFDAVGRLDESIFYGPEDVDFCLRVRSAGHRVVQVAGADVRHPPRRSFRRPLTVRGMRHGWSILRHTWRHRSRGPRRQTSAGA
jgi:GT2 family glycosyltransferase